jgi:hypothetical protein
MKSYLLSLFFSLFLIKTTFSQILLPTPPEDVPSTKETQTKNTFIDEYKIKTVIEGENILHVNKYFNISCKNRGKNLNLAGLRWMMTSENPFSISPEVSIYAIKKVFFQNSPHHLQAGFNLTFDNWNIEKIAQYFFDLEHDNNVPIPLRRDKKTNTLVGKQKIKIDDLDFAFYQFDVDGKTMLENRYLTIIDDLVFIINERKKVGDTENIMKSFKRNK